MFIPLWLMIPLAFLLICVVLAAAQEGESRARRLESSRGWYEEEESDPYL